MRTWFGGEMLEWVIGITNTQNCNEFVLGFRKVRNEKIPSVTRILLYAIFAKHHITTSIATVRANKFGKPASQS